MRFGVDYYPEHWPEERWETDAALMAEAGVNVVRLAEFAWSRLEPEEGRFNFDWLDAALDTLQRHGIQAILGTPTASPPPWVMAAYPQAFRVREDGRSLTFGNRREYCPTNLDYRRLSRRITAAMAAHYANHPAVIGWQIDNEFGDRCYCPSCQARFQAWLQTRYASLDQLNEEWGTIFWSHVYSDWSQIPVPLSTGHSPNPGLGLDFARCMSDMYVEFQQEQVVILRKECPQHFITHNFMGFGYKGLNYFDLASALDLVTWDNYPRTQWNMQPGVNSSAVALGHDTMRGLKGKNFWMMEQQGGPGGWELVSVSPRPGELRLWAYQALAHGADGMIFFRWRTALRGTEQYWHGLLDHDGTAGRRYQELRRMGLELKQAGDLIEGAQVRAQVAMLLSYDSRWAFDIQGNNPQFDYGRHFIELYTAFNQRGVAVDVVAPGADLSAYKLVVVPAMYVLPQAAADVLRGFVENGGVLVATARTGVKDEANAIVNQRLPGLLAEVCGVEVEEYDSLAPGMANALAFDLPELAQNDAVVVNIWCDVLKPLKAEVVAHYTQDYYAGRAAITCNSFGKGRAIYLGTLGAGLAFDGLADWVLGVADVAKGMAAPVGVEVTQRWQGQQRLLFVLNHNESAQDLALDGTYINLLDGQRLSGWVRLEGREVWVLAQA